MSAYQKNPFRGSPRDGSASPRRPQPGTPTAPPAARRLYVLPDVILGAFAPPPLAQPAAITGQ